jgi:two-component system cell cycle sensor histidine kinase/response regulator CckA
MNLAIDARDAMPDGGTLTIRAGRCRLGGGDPTFTNHVMVEVADEGVGMDEKTLSHVFEPFFTTKEANKGTGLGLATVYGIGDSGPEAAWMCRRPWGRGRRSACICRAWRRMRPRRLRPSTAAAGIPSRERVLLVEDEDIVRDLLARTLRKAGYDVHASPLPSEAVAWVAEGHPVDLVVTDVVMPEKSGPELVRDLEAEASPGARRLHFGIRRGGGPNSAASRPTNAFSRSRLLRRNSSPSSRNCSGRRSKLRKDSNRRCVSDGGDRR